MAVTHDRRAPRVVLMGLAILLGVTTPGRPAPSATRPPAAAPAAPATAPAAPATAPADAVGDGLLALHQGDYSRAFDDFRQAVDAAPGDPGPLFFCAFSRWWQMIFADETPSRDTAAWTAFVQAYDAATGAASARLESAPDDPRALTALGAAEVLRAHLEAIVGGYFRAGGEARRGKKALRQALEKSPDLDEALFAMGALNYFADRVPLVVKTIRPLLFLPGGDASLGLSQVRRVAFGSGRLRIDGRLLLGLVCADHYQRAFKDALAHLEVARAESGGSPLIAAAIGDLQERLGEPDEAAATLGGAAERALGPGPERARQRRWLRLGQAEALAAAWRLDEAEAALRQAQEEPGAASSAMQRLDRRIREELSVKRTAYPVESERERADPIGALTAAIGADPVAPTPRLARGRLLYLSGRDQEALGDLAVAASGSHDGPAWLQGWIQIYSGLAEARLGHAAEARDHFRAAAAVRRFRASDRGLLELGERGKDAALCAP
jgi:tetratricopeptide (TPR) repeat protein